MSPVMSPRGTIARIPSSHGTHPQLTPGSLPNAILTECSRCWVWRGWGNAKCPSSGLVTQKPALSAFPRGLRGSWARKAQLAAQRVLVTLKAAPGLEPPLPILLLNPLGPSDLALPTPPAQDRVDGCGCQHPPQTQPHPQTVQLHDPVIETEQSGTGVNSPPDWPPRGCYPTSTFSPSGPQVGTTNPATAGPLLNSRTSA